MNVLKPTNNFLNWYKHCCEKDLSVYRKAVYNTKKAYFYYFLVFKKEYAIYCFNGKQEIIGGTKNFCENYIKENINSKFFIFSIKKDEEVEYLIKNDTIFIL